MSHGGLEREPGQLEAEASLPSSGLNLKGDMVLAFVKAKWQTTADAQRAGAGVVGDRVQAAETGGSCPGEEA